MTNDMIAEMNEKLKTIKIYGDLKTLRKEYKDKVGFVLCLKKNNRCKIAYYLNGDWAKCDYFGSKATEEDITNDTRMRYIVDGDDRVRECMVCNLWRYVEFVEW